MSRQARIVEVTPHPSRVLLLRLLVAEGLDGRCGMSECEECGACIAVHDATAILRGES